MFAKRRGTGEGGRRKEEQGIKHDGKLATCSSSCHEVPSWIPRTHTDTKINRDGEHVVNEISWGAQSGGKITLQPRRKVTAALSLTVRTPWQLSHCRGKRDTHVQCRR